MARRRITDVELDEMHHEDCHVRTLARLFEEPECNCPVQLVRDLRAAVTVLAGELEAEADQRKHRADYPYAGTGAGDYWQSVAYRNAAKRVRALTG